MRRTQVSETQENLPLQMIRPTPHNILLDFEHLLSSMLRQEVQFCPNVLWSDLATDRS